MDNPTSPLAHGFEALDLSGLARVTSKTFERLAPYTLIQSSSPEARPTIKKITNKIQAYIEAIDTSVHVVYTIYQMSKIAAALWTNPASLNDKHTFAERMHRQKHLKDIMVLVDEAHKKAQKTTTVFKQAQQEFYRIAASTKDMDCIVQIPVDPTLRESIPEDTSHASKITKILAEVIKKPLKEIGPDLVSNLNLLADFTRHSSDLTTWCGWINSSIVAADGTVVPPQDGSLVDANTIRPKWDRIRADCLIFHSIISEILDRYNSMLPTSSDVWCATMRDVNMSANTKAAAEMGRTSGRGSKLSRQVSSLLQDAVRHLSCHTQSNFAA